MTTPEEIVPKDITEETQQELDPVVVKPERQWEWLPEDGKHDYEE
jgi:hypothetical protein